MFNFIIQLLVMSSIISLSAGKTLTEFHVNESRLQQPRDYPCPNATDIAPCVCTYDTDRDRLTLNCTDISSDEELANILMIEFPVKDFYEFTMESSPSLTALNFTCGGVKFQRFDLSIGPFPSLVEVSGDFYNSCSSEYLQSVQLYQTQLSSLVFPPTPLSNKITQFLMPYSNLASVPPISSVNLLSLDLSGGQIPQIVPGTLDDIPNLRNINFQYNNIKILENGTMPITYNGYFYYLSENELETIEPGAFFLKGHPGFESLWIYLYDNLLKTIDASVFEFLMPYIDVLRIDDNPLDCGCDLAWIITNPDYLDKVTAYGPPTCADGTLLTDLDPTLYEELC